jgi:hypothetical protein
LADVSGGVATLLFAAVVDVVDDDDALSGNDGVAALRFDDDVGRSRDDRGRDSAFVRYRGSMRRIEKKEN